MRLKLFAIAIGLIFAFTSCFEDEGNYDVVPIEGPIWDYEYESSPTRIYAHEGDSTNTVPLFHFPAHVDSTRFIYEWRSQNGTLFCTDRNIKLASDTLWARLGIKSYLELNGQNGTFSVIDPVHGYKFLVRTYFQAYGKIRQRDWIILSEENGKSKINCITYRQSRDANNNIVTKYVLKDGPTVEGTPRALFANKDKGISSAIYCKNVVTSAGAFVLNNMTLEIASDLSQEFSNGTPANFDVVWAYNKDQNSLLMMSDGRMYQRVQSDNFLGGKFSSEPYYVDEKGYDVTYVGTRRPGGYAPAWDAKNRRVLMINQSKPFNIIPVTYNELYEDQYEDPLWGMPEGTEVLYMYMKKENSNTYCIIYNDANGDTWMTDFVANAGVLDKDKDKKERFPAGNLKKGTQFLTTAATYGPHGTVLHYYIFYAEGNTIKYVSRENNSFGDYFTFDGNASVQFNDGTTGSFGANEKIVAFHYFANQVEYNMMWVALESGKCGYLNFNNQLLSPVLEPGSWFNLGRKIVDISQVNYYTFTDWPGK